MKVTTETIPTLPIEDKDKGLLRALLEDLADLNAHSTKGEVYIDWQDYHDEYSSERTEPCPDYYGMYHLYMTGDFCSMGGSAMELEYLDWAICLLSDYVLSDERNND